MREKGFATLFGLCMILTLALVFMGISASEENHGGETLHYNAEYDLQNAAVGGIYKAIDTVIEYEEKSAPDEPLFDKMTGSYEDREKFQHHFAPMTITTEGAGKITVETWGERLYIQPYDANPSKDVAEKNGTGREAYVFYSIASADAKVANGKIYGRAYAYVFVNNDNHGKLDADLVANEKSAVHFLELPNRDITLKY